MKNDQESRDALELEKTKAMIRKLKNRLVRMKAREKSLQDSMESYRHLSENIPCAAYSVLPHENIPPVFLSSKIEEITGYPAEAFLKDPPLKMKIVHPNDRDRVRQALEDARKNKSPLDIEYRIRTRNGQEKWVRDKGSSVLGNAGNKIRINGFMEDITSRVRMEKALIQSEERYRELVENAGEIIIVLQDERIKYFNRKTLELTGYTRDEIYFTPFDKFVHPEDMEKIVTRYAQRITGMNLDERHQFRIRIKDGSYLWAEVGSRLIEWEGRPAILDFITDISDTKEAQDALYRSEQQLKSTFDSIKESVCLLDTENRILKHNRAMGGLCGKRHEVIENRYCYEVVHGLNHRFEDCPFEEMVRTRHRAGITMDLDGRWYEVSIDPIITRDNELIGGVHIMRDITRKKLDEKQRSDMEQRARQARKFESLGIMAGGIAHDFNNLLTAVLGNLELAEISAGPSSSIIGLIQQAKEAAVRAADLTRKVLAYTGRGRFDVQQLNLTAFIESMGPEIDSFIFNTILAEKELDHALPSIMADPSQIKQVVTSLITNAAESIGDKKGEIIIRTGTMECDEEYLGKSHIHADLMPGIYVYLDVEDNGHGMDQYTIERLFDPFFTTKFPGRGLGMPATHGIVRSHDGAIMVDSLEGKGTTIRLLFPVYEKEKGMDQ